MHMRTAGSILSILIVCSPVIHAQSERFELGQRLRAFENAWEKQTDVEARKRAVEPLLKATSAFFSFKLAEAGRELDHARLALAGDQPPSAQKLWAASLRLTLHRHALDDQIGKKPPFLDVRAGKVYLRLAFLYAVDQAVPAQAEWRVRLLAEKDGASLAEIRQDVAELPATGLLKWNNVPPGDHTLRLEVLIGGVVQSTVDQTLSLVENLDKRLGVLKKLPHEDAQRNVEGQTFGELRRIVQSLADGKTLETNYPAARLLAEAEALPEALRKGENYYAYPKAGQFWLRIAVGSNKETVRVFIPDKLTKNRPAPLVIALHGAGGSENMFFEGYGNGKIVRLCQERGWVLVAPRLSPFAAPIGTDALIAELAGRWPIDKKRVFLVGHSMGAMHAVQIAAKMPKQFAGVAALGGGQKIDAEPLVDVPFFVGVGSRDFLLRSVRALHDSLTVAEVKTVVFREYPDLEHLVIVQQALPDVFAFFDGIVKKK